MKLYQYLDDPHVPFDINSHPIPANENKKEPAHFHHDFRYLFIYLSDRPIIPDPEESTGAVWVDLVTLSDRSDYHHLIGKIRTIL